MFKKSFGRKSSSSAISRPLDVVLIGCGPSGMALLHALKSCEGKDLMLPNITCYERASSPGGLWRDVPVSDPERNKPENKVLMYDDLWTNRPKEAMEFFDYTFDEHFKKPTPSYLPREDILDYLLKRNSVDGALDDVKFSHTVKSVTYDEKSEKFNVTVTDDSSGSTTTSAYDRCVWAGGLHGFLEDPDELDSFLDDYKGKKMHSSEANENFEEDVKGKVIMTIGDGYSAEDLALRAVKLGAKKVYICSRSELGTAADTEYWPEDKVEIVYGVPYKNVKDTGFKCQYIYWSEKKQKYRKDDEELPKKIKHIDTVILCTGYNENLGMLDPSLRFDTEKTWDLPKSWEMENNPFTISLGNITPSKSLLGGGTVYLDVYRSVLIKNPKVMFINEYQDTACDFLEIDVNAWLVLRYLTGEVEIPQEKEMIKNNNKQLITEMNFPWLRNGIDRAYNAELNDLDDNHWSSNGQDERSLTMEKQIEEFKVKLLARDMKTAKYPFDLGKFDKLNDKGKQFVDILLASHRTRTMMDKGQTFRDVLHPDFKSLYTNTPSCALPANWINLKADGGNRLSDFA